MKRTKTRRAFGAAIAQRDLAVTGSRAKVKVEIGKPFKGDRCFTCPIRISAGKKVVHRQIHGVDTFQALELGLKMIGTLLRHADGLPVGRMYAYEQGDDMGFPEVLGL